MNLYRASYFQPKNERTIINVKKCSHIFSEGFPHSSVGKEYAYSAGDPGCIPGPGKSAGEGTAYPLQYSWAPLVAQLVNNPPVIWETWV